MRPGGLAVRRLVGLVRVDRALQESGDRCGSSLESQATRQGQQGVAELPTTGTEPGSNSGAEMSDEFVQFDNVDSAPGDCRIGFP